MSSPKEMMDACPFPRQRPEITITPTDETPFEVDWRELAWWFAVPQEGERALWAIYDPPSWGITSWTDMSVVRPAVVHAIDCVEIDSTDRDLDGQWQPNPWTFYARLTDDRVQYLANLSLQNGKRRLYTFLDKGFDEDWGESQRRVRQAGRFEELPDGSYRQRTQGEQVEALGVCEVAIGGQSFTCLRVVDVKCELTDKSILMEGYLTRDGRTVLCRRYNGRQWHREPGRAHAAEPPWDERFPTHNRIIIDGVTFVHWYDCLADRGAGIDVTALPPHVL